jgi:hypothetical protein
LAQPVAINCVIENGLARPGAVDNSEHRWPAGRFETDYTCPLPIATNARLRACLRLEWRHGSGYDGPVPNGRPVLTFDLDGVICRPPFGINPGQGKGKSREGQGRRSILWRTERWRYLGRKPMPGAAEGFRALSETFDCKVLSARSNDARSLTAAWFERHIGVVPDLHLRSDWHETPAQFKARKVLELQPLAHFEDDSHTALWLAELLPAVFLVDWRRNRWLGRESVAKLHRIKSIADAIPVLAALSTDPAGQ